MTRRNLLKKKLKKLLPAVTVSLTVFPFAAWSPVAEAFFPPVWPVSPPTVVVPPVSPPPVIVVPPVSPPPFVPPPPPPVIVVPPVSPPPIIVPPVSPPPMCGTPEPATLVSGLIGLAAAAGYGLKRRGKKEEPKTE
jgi:hypothetical protein